MNIIQPEDYPDLDLAGVETQIASLPVTAPIRVRISSFGGTDSPAEIHELAIAINRNIETTWQGCPLTISPEMTRERVRQLFKNKE